MKKFVFVLTFITAILCLFCVSCNKPTNYGDYVSELRSNLYEGETDDLKLKVGYGYKLGTSEQKIYALTFKILNALATNTEYSVHLLFGGKEYEKRFTYNPVSDSLTASLEIADFNLNEFTATIKYGSESKTVVFKSIVDEKALTLNQTLEKLTESQKPLLDSYFSGDTIDGRIVARIIVKNNKPYWYIGLVKNSDTKALLIDGLSGKILAIREIF